MKKLLALTILVSGVTFSTFAQEGGKKERMRKPLRNKKEMVNRTPEEIAKKRTEMLNKELKFSDKQRQEVYKLQLDQAQDLKVKREELKKQRENARKEFLNRKEKFEKILTPEQKEIFKSKLAKQRSEGRFKKDRDGRKFEKRNFHQRDSIKRVG